MEWLKTSIWAASAQSQFIDLCSFPEWKHTGGEQVSSLCPGLFEEQRKTSFSHEVDVLLSVISESGSTSPEPLTVLHLLWFMVSLSHLLSNSFTIMSLSTSTGLWNSQVGDYGPEQKVNLQENSLWGFWERPHLCAIDHRLCVGKKRKGRKKELKKEINNKLRNWKEKIIEKGTWKKEKERSRICCCTKTFQSCELNPI